MLARAGILHGAPAFQRRPRIFKRDGVELLLMCMERRVHPRQLLVVQHVALALLDRLDAVVVFRLELLEDAHHRVIDLLGVALRNTRLGLGRRVGDLEIHL